MDADREPIPPIYGDPDGPHWVAVPHGPTPETAEPPVVIGDALRFMWDYGVVVPLWDETGLLPDEPEWLREQLGLSDDLIRALTEWGRDMNKADEAPRKRRARSDWEQAYQELDARARALVERLRAELAGRYEVAYHQW
jgi:hypothetical protein